eukprot:CAMPEP_0114341626 /NCGR_PEP_ID=MMETSP0101-20121206/9173_1 /TAXON_ID=38822 ORGANISM="Pteridomonas danica, Strain PT" /NCGR_SAMPLE_ID=MMETSP0101 /ASSEMBLY_ACC=CAM_ASM_000211 /LENGTH=238 /DNA_ID=CAMNT_0001475293 /DNA_START=11 /DNA_END=727 /DNA_ORIENTATION=+
MTEHQMKPGGKRRTLTEDEWDMLNEWNNQFPKAPVKSAFDFEECEIEEEEHGNFSSPTSSSSSSTDDDDDCKYYSDDENNPNKQSPISKHASKQNDNELHTVTVNVELKSKIDSLEKKLETSEQNVKSLMIETEELRIQNCELSSKLLKQQENSELVILSLNKELKEMKNEYLCLFSEEQELHNNNTKEKENMSKRETELVDNANKIPSSHIVHQLSFMMRRPNLKAPKKTINRTSEN